MFSNKNKKESVRFPFVYHIFSPSLKINMSEKVIKINMSEKVIFFFLFYSFEFLCFLLKYIVLMFLDSVFYDLIFLQPFSTYKKNSCCLSHRETSGSGKNVIVRFNEGLSSKLKMTDFNIFVKLNIIISYSISNDNLFIQV